MPRHDKRKSATQTNPPQETLVPTPDAGAGRTRQGLPYETAGIRLSPELSTVLNTALDNILEVIRVEGGVVRLLDQETDELVLVASRGLGEQMARTTRRLKIGEGLPGLAVAQGEPIVVERLSHDPKLAGVPLRQDGYESYMVVPLRLHNRMVGTLSLFTKTPRGFDTYERSFFSQVGATIENALLYEEAARREQEAAFLDRATQLFNSTLELDDVLQRVAMMATEVLGDSCTINLLEEGAEFLTPVATYHPNPEARRMRLQIQRDDPVRIGDPGSVVGLAARTGRPYLVKDARHDGRLKYVDRLNLYSVLAAPICLKQKVLGVLASGITHPFRQFTATDLRVAVALADRAALPIENSRLYGQERQLRQQMEELTRQVQEANQRKTEFVTLVSHELRTPLSSITGYVNLLLEGQGGECTGAQREYLGIVQRNAGRLAKLIDDLLDIARIEAGKIELKRTRLDVIRLVREVANMLRPQIEAKQQRLVLDLPHSLPAIVGDGGRITQILTNLLSNAHKYTPSQGRITIKARDEKGRVCVSVEDTGIGLAPEEQAHLFTKFFRAHHGETHGVEGTGLGLAISRALVEVHGGDISVASTPGRGSTFSVSLPALHS